MSDSGLGAAVDIPGGGDGDGERVSRLRHRQPGTSQKKVFPSVLDPDLGRL